MNHICKWNNIINVYVYTIPVVTPAGKIFQYKLFHNNKSYISYNIPIVHFPIVKIFKLYQTL